MKKLALFDFDNVIYKGHSIFDIIQAQEKDDFIKTGVWDNVKNYLEKYKKNQISYKTAADKMLEAWAQGLAGKKYQEVVKYVDNYFANNPENFSSWFIQTRSNMNNYDIYVVTTNYQFIAESVVNRFNLTGYISSEAEVSGELFTGRVNKSLAGNKDTVITLLDRYPLKGSIAVGDSENDLNMLKKVDVPICYQPDDKLKRHAKKRGWLIINEESVTKSFDVIIKGS